MPSRLVKRNGVWHVRLQRGGWDTLISCGTGNRRQAEASAEMIVSEFDREKHARTLARKICQYALELARGESGLERLKGPLAALELVEYRQCLDVIAKIFPAPAVTAPDIWRMYEASPEPDSAKERTKASRKSHFDAFARWAGKRDLRDMDEAKCRQALDGMGVKGQTRNNYISDLSTIFSRAGVDAPWKDLRVVAEHKEGRSADMDAVRKYLAFCDADPERCVWGIPLARWGAITRVLYYTGMRPSDVVRFERSWVKDGLVEFVPEKTSRTRKKVSFLAHPALLRLLDGMPEEGPCFADFQDRFRRANSFFCQALKDIFRLAGMPEDSFRMYDFRHHFATAMVDSGANMDDVAAAIGHVSTGTTSDHYYHGRRAVSLPEMPEI